MAGEESLSGKDASGYAKAKRVIERTFLDIDKRFQKKEKPKHVKNESR